MELHKQNKEFIVDYFKALSGVAKTQELLQQYIKDEELIGHIAVFEMAFPGYEIISDQMTAEENRVVVQARLTGNHKGEFNGIPPTYRDVNIPFVTCKPMANSMNNRYIQRMA